MHFLFTTYNLQASNLSQTVHATAHAHLRGYRKRRGGTLVECHLAIELLGREALRSIGPAQGMPQSHVEWHRGETWRVG